MGFSLPETILHIINRLMFRFVLNSSGEREREREREREIRKAKIKTGEIFQNTFI